MDVSVLAAVGSFVVSERVLKPKATVLAILGCVLAYDLTTKTHDTSSLRVYRGPALLAVTLIMCALSLRTWRRNGVACDELLFLPGTSHGERHGVDTNHNSNANINNNNNNLDTSCSSNQSSLTVTKNNLQNPNGNMEFNEGDVAAGGILRQTLKPGNVMARTIELMPMIGGGSTRGRNSQLQSTILAEVVPPSTCAQSNNSASGNNNNGNLTTGSAHGVGMSRSLLRHSSTGRGRSSVTGSSTSSAASETRPPLLRNRSLSKDSSRGDLSLNSIQEFVNSWDEGTSEDNDNLTERSNFCDGDIGDDDDDDDDGDDTSSMMMPLNALAAPTGDAAQTNLQQNPVATQQQLQQPLARMSSRSSNAGNNNVNNSAAVNNAPVDPLDMSNNSSSSSAMPTVSNRTAATTAISGGGPHHSRQRSLQGDAVERFRDSHPRITRIGSFFFFRSSATSTHNAAYAPSGPSVVGAALDLSMPILFNFHLFIEAYNHIEKYGGSETPAKILPLIFLSVLIVRSVFPPGRRCRFWKTMKYTMTAPFHRIRFRDAFIGDCMTSLVRPMQDVMFALSYYVTVIMGTVSGKYGLSESGTILESSWVLHNVVLPSCAMLPLWWRFLQTLRQCYDTKSRWPHLGNAFKHLSAALVILYGMTHPDDRRSPWWLVCFLLSVMYQIWWDTVMDWQLFVIAPRSDETVDFSTGNALCPNFNPHAYLTGHVSYSPDSVVLPFIMNFCQPVKDLFRFLVSRLPNWKQIQIRPRRLYKTEIFYWRIFFYNSICRFTWMLCFIPAYHLSASGKKEANTFSTDTNSYLGVLLPVAEIVRRTLWGFLLLEMETIKMQDEDPSYARLYTDNFSGDSYDYSLGADSIDEESQMLDEEASLHDQSEFSIDSSKFKYLPSWLGAAVQQHQQKQMQPQQMQLIPQQQQQLQMQQQQQLQMQQQQLQIQQSSSPNSNSTLESSNATATPSTVSSAFQHFLGTLATALAALWSGALVVTAALKTKFGPYLQMDEETKNKLFVAELGLWAAAFVVLGLWATC